MLRLRRNGRRRARQSRHHGPERTFRFIGIGPRNLPVRLRGDAPLNTGDTFTDTVVNWASKADYELVIPHTPPDEPATMSPSELKSLSWAEAKAYALEHYGIRARGWKELVREYKMIRG